MNRAEAIRVLDAAWAGRDRHVHALGLFEDAAVPTAWRVDMTTRVTTPVTVREVLSASRSAVADVHKAIAEHTRRGTIDKVVQKHLLDHTKHLYFHDLHDAAHLASLVTKGSALLPKMAAQGPAVVWSDIRAAHPHDWIDVESHDPASGLYYVSIGGKPDVWHRVPEERDQPLTADEWARYRAAVAEFSAGHDEVNEPSIEQRVGTWAKVYSLRAMP